MRDNIQAVLIFATKLKFTERATQSEHRHRRPGERGPRRAPGLTRSSRRGSLLCGREGGKLYPDRMGGEVVARGAGSVRGWERSSTAVRFFSFLNGTRCSNQTGKYCMRGDGDFFSFRYFQLFFIVFEVLLGRAVLSLSHIQHITRRK